MLDYSIEDYTFLTQTITILLILLTLGKLTKRVESLYANHNSLSAKVYSKEEVNG